MLDVKNVDKDDLTVRIKNTSGEAIGVSGRSKYAGINQILYEVNLYDGYAFSAGETYYPEAVSDRPVYHNYRDRSIGVFDQFVILWSGRDGGNLAIFVIRTVNAPQEEATFRLYKDEGERDTPWYKTLPFAEKSMSPLRMVRAVYCSWMQENTGSVSHMDMGNPTFL